jgi:hypothetical protein
MPATSHSPFKSCWLFEFVFTDRGNRKPQPLSEADERQTPPAHAKSKSSQRSDMSLSVSALRLRIASPEENQNPFFSLNENDFGPYSNLRDLPYFWKARSAHRPSEGGGRGAEGPRRESRNEFSRARCSALLLRLQIESLLHMVAESCNLPSHRRWKHQNSHRLQHNRPSEWTLTKLLSDWRASDFP